MRAYRVLAALLALALVMAAIDGCKKRETKPAPQVAESTARVPQVPEATERLPRLAGATAGLLRYNSRQLGL
jgi:hypothetical protein